MSVTNVGHLDITPETAHWEDEHSHEKLKEQVNQNILICPFLAGITVNTMGEMLNTLTLMDGQVAALGAVVEAEVELEGHPTKALIDSGSPVTIVALKKLLRVWKDNHPTSDTDKQWLEEAKAKLRDPTIKLVTYGGSPIELLGEAEAKLSVNGVEATVTVLVHEDPSQEILLGTDTLAKLDSHLFFEE